MSAIIEIEDYGHFKVEDGDEIFVEKNYCGKCECTHSRIFVRRKGKEICQVGSDVKLHGDDEVYGGVIVDDKGLPLPDPHWVTHIIPNDKSGMTPGMEHYVSLCGKVLLSISDDRITFDPELKFLRDKEKSRLCPDCLKIRDVRVV